MKPTTRDTSKLILYAMELEKENKELRAHIEKLNRENDRLRVLRRQDREIAADYRAIVEGDVA